MSEITLTLPYPPSVNNYKRIGRTITTKRGKLIQQRFNSPETTAFFYEVYIILRQTVLINDFKGFTDDIVLEASIDLYPPDRRRHDVDNRCKLVLDALQRGGLYSNDYNIRRLVVERKDIIQHGQIIVRIKPYVAQP